jgi:hypothetical protein
MPGPFSSMNSEYDSGHQNNRADQCAKYEQANSFFAVHASELIAES